MKNLTIEIFEFYELFIKKLFNFNRKFYHFTLIKKIMISLFFLLPWAMMIGRTLADLIVVIIFLTFLIRSTFFIKWNWLKNKWLIFSFIFWILGLVSSLYSFSPEQSFLNGLVWIRFPIFAVASIYWLLDEKDIRYLILINSFLITIVIILISFSEITYFIIINNYLSITKLIWPFDNPLVGNYITRLGLPIFLLSIYLTFNSKLLLKLISISFLLIYSFVILLAGYKVGILSSFIASLILLYFIKVKLKEFLYFSAIILLFLVLFFYFNQYLIQKFFLVFLKSSDYGWTHNSLLQYSLIWKTGLNYFFENIIIGMGPTNFQNFFLLNDVSEYISEHPHNHYIQAFTETGIFGGIAYVSFVIFMVYQTTKKALPENKLDDFFNIIPLAISISLFWPLANSFDLYGQQQNSYLWYMIVIALSINHLNDNEKN